MFEAAVDNVALGGRIIAIGMAGSYTAGENGSWAQSKHEVRESRRFSLQRCVPPQPSACGVSL